MVTNGPINDFFIYEQLLKQEDLVSTHFEFNFKLILIIAISGNRVKK